MSIMKWFKEWASDPVRVFNTLSAFLAGVLSGMLFTEYLK
jgi:hypothetical protein